MNHKTMKTVALASAALFALHFAPAAQAQDPSEASAALSLTIDGLTADSGRVWVGVYDSADAWEAQEETRSVWAEIEDGQAVLVIEDAPVGALGVQVFHDANGNQDFDTNMLGVPRERYGFSNNPRPPFRGANWDEAMFDLAPGERRDMTISVHGVRG